MADRMEREKNRIDKEAYETVKKMNSRLDKIDKKAAQRGLERSEANIKASKALIVRTLHIKSLKVLEAIADEKNVKPKQEGDIEFLKPYIAMYIYYAKHDKVNKIFYPNLYRLMKEYEAALLNASKNDPYYEVFQIMEFRRDRKQNANQFMIEAVYYINKIIEQENISINQLAEAAGLKYANVYNLLKKPEKMGCLSVKNTHKLLWIADAFRNGWTKEEALAKHMEKLEQLWLHWHVDIDLTELKEEGE